MSRDPRQQRIGSKYLPRIIFGFLIVIFAVGLFVIWNIITALPAQRTSFIVVGDPVQILSWNEARLTLTVIPLPVDVYLDGVYGVGSLSVASLRKLEALDAKKKGLFVKSLENTFALPIVGVWSDLSPALRFRLWWIRKWLRPDAVKMINLDERAVFRSATLPDGSQVRVFDGNRFDSVIGNHLEVDSIRREKFRIRVVNTTDIVGLANRAARFLNRVGMTVVAVENERSVQKECTMNTIWATVSVQFIRNAFNCATTTTDLDERADVIVRLGEDYAQRFKSD